MIRKAIALIFLSCVIFCLQASAQTADDLIKKNIEARGGLEKLRAIKSMRITAKVHSEGMSIQLVIQIKRPGLVRGDATIQGVTLVKAYDGETAWQVNAFEGSKEPEKIDSREAIEIGDIDGPLLDYKAKGNAVELLGKEEMDGTPVYKLKVTLKAGYMKYLYLDAKTYLALKQAQNRKEEGKAYDLEELYSDYKAVAGVMIAHSRESRINGEINDQIIVEKIEVNVPVDDSIFKMPKKTQEKKP